MEESYWCSDNSNLFNYMMHIIKIGCFSTFFDACVFTVFDCIFDGLCQVWLVSGNQIQEEKMSG